MCVRKLQSRIRVQSRQNAAKQQFEFGGNFTSTITDIVGHRNHRTLAYDLTHWCTLLWSLTGLCQICSLRSVWVCSVKPKLSMTSSHTGYDPKSTCLNLWGCQMLFISKILWWKSAVSNAIIWAHIVLMEMQNFGRGRQQFLYNPTEIPEKTWSKMLLYKCYIKCTMCHCLMSIAILIVIYATINTAYCTF
jgi:hypothetical protein